MNPGSPPLHLCFLSVNPWPDVKLDCSAKIDSHSGLGAVIFGSISRMEWQLGMGPSQQWWCNVGTYLIYCNPG